MVENLFFGQESLDVQVSADFKEFRLVFVLLQESDVLHDARYRFAGLPGAVLTCDRQQRAELVRRPNELVPVLSLFPVIGILHESY